jgi:predicted Zn finger-like uncharacterized protein
MRLICPNCSAQYEIDGSMIPDEGRDVQCSNCGHTWFELPPQPEFSEDDEPAVAAQADEDADDSPEPTEEIEADTPEDNDGLSAAVRALAAATNEVEAAEHESDDELDDDGEAPEPTSPVAPTHIKPRRPADAAALDILKEEAERELAQRRAPPSQPIETQTDMALDEIRDRDTPSRALRARMARLRGEDEPERAETPKIAKEQPSDGYQAPRRDLLPDIDEINSSLSPKRGGARRSSEDVAVQRSGFRTGFLLMIVLAALMIFAYAWAPAIADNVPAAETALLIYVDWANGVRDWIDALMAGT